MKIFKTTIYAACLFFSFASTSTGATSIKEDFPKIMGMNIGRPISYDNFSYIQEMGKVDVLVMNFWPRWKDYKYGQNSIRSIVSAIKAYNPDIVIGQYTILNESQDTQSQDKSNADRAEKLEKENWWLRDNRKRKLRWTDKYNAWDINITEFTKPDADGMRYPEWLAHRNHNIFFKNIPEFEFWYLDNTLSQSPAPAADWFLDGINRMPTDAVVAKAYRKGHVQYWNNIRQLQPDTMLIGNSDNLNSEEYSMQLNGAFLEAVIGKNWSTETRKGWPAMMQRYYSFMKNTLPPKIVGFNVWGKSNDFQRLRYGLASCLMNDGFFSYTDESQGYSSVPWFDEFDVDLGKPVDPPPMAAWKDGIYRRLFERGLVLVNPTNQNKVVTIEAGFRRINGKQAPNINNGKPVNTITLSPKDGIILIR
ncbi:MAG TPA: hypothetical protein DCZ48_13960 [Methylococcaceae bacterium]|nr:hypothetical protein [Methylococcaceae bacterium]